MFCWGGTFLFEKANSPEILNMTGIRVWMEILPSCSLGTLEKSSCTNGDDQAHVELNLPLSK
jgi:hypothetical protein